MSDLFESSEPPVIHLALPDLQLTLIRHLFDDRLAQFYFDSLFSLIRWQSAEVRVWGKTHVQPRLIAWHGDDGASYKYSGVRLFPSPWNATLSELRTIVEQASLSRFNSVLLNLYRNESDHMGWHSDDEKELGPTPTIASLSLGGTRQFRLRHRNRPDIRVKSLALSSGSLLIMSGATQQHWTHSIKKERQHTPPRINLTFRNILHLAPSEGRTP